MSVIGGTDADPVNEANGDFSVGDPDVSIPTFGPSLISPGPTTRRSPRRKQRR